MKYTALATEKKTDKKAEKKPVRSGKVVARKAKPPGEIRIIGGQYKRTKLPVPHKPGLRPTPDRVRETLFNWLGHDLTGWHCVDVFAGTGALGFEAASRGATEVLLCEQDPGLVLRLKALQTQLQAGMVRIERGDGVGLLRRLPAASMQLVLLDPPFESELFEPALKAAVQVLGPTGLVYLEAPRHWLDEELQPLGLRVHRSGKAGAVHFHLLVRIDS
ncbi:16S rRNA (guanine(966)-N(2))-methyltransferase RsmD [Polaromonas sp. JS666]|uniref:16S rRNA (guanine(966)-N(2))-methyltransferase RsmD n=1 Tax=Polaromonas sp. (strain JS666 / ATCC BAA-500) TaxID=296591 RepID=UPI0000464989|nr:16S rRNA (guanine(966)-N(2))-methyltransferase RsmD [Polaromonas sp. JS666]ABE43231.1 conserved hypothetical protein 95 [Polaromonas sp. JS666]